MSQGSSVGFQGLQRIQRMQRFSVFHWEDTFVESASGYTEIGIWVKMKTLGVVLQKEANGQGQHLKSWCQDTFAQSQGPSVLPKSLIINQTIPFGSRHMQIPRGAHGYPMSIWRFYAYHYGSLRSTLWTQMLDVSPSVRTGNLKDCAFYLKNCAFISIK